MACLNHHSSSVWPVLVVIVAHSFHFFTTATIKKGDAGTRIRCEAGTVISNTVTQMSHRDWWSRSEWLAIISRCNMENWQVPYHVWRTQSYQKVISFGYRYVDFSPSYQRTRNKCRFLLEQLLLKRSLHSPAVTEWHTAELLRILIAPCVT